MATLGPVTTAHKFDEDGLAAYLAEQGFDDFRNGLEAQQFQGGQSNPTFMLAAGGTRYVLRKKPPGKLLPSAHMIEREYKVMLALQGSDVPVPEMMHLCEDDTIIGTPFYLMGYLEGRIFDEPELNAPVEPEHRRKVYEHMSEILANLHGIDPAAVGLGEFGRTGGYIERQVSRWSKQFEMSRTEDLPAMDKLMEWLPNNIPGPDETTIVHGDFRLGNMMLHPTEPRVIAVLDWELATLGHPLSDLAYFCMPYNFPHGKENFKGLVGLDYEALGIPNEPEILKLYQAAAGRDEIENWTFYMAFSMFRISAIVQGVYKRGLDGNASSENARDYGQKAIAAAETGWNIVEKQLGGAV